MDLPQVSVILPIYNSENDVTTSMGEVEKQTFGSFELIVVDDGSTDKTFAVAEAFSRGRAGIRVIRTDHLGPSHARNTGLGAARGEIVVFVESDCVYDPSYLSKAVDRLVTDPVAAAVCLTGAPLITRDTLATRCIEIENKIQRRLLSEGKIAPFYAWVFRKTSLEKLGGFDEALFQAEDKDLFRRMKRANYKVALVPGINWRHRRDQTTPELAKKWFSRGRIRLLFVWKNGLVVEALKTILPLWGTIAGAVLLVFYPLVGAAIMVAVASLFVAASLRVAALSWGLVDKKRAFVGYPLFAIVRNFATALGYTVALPILISRKVVGKEISWRSM